jgi:tetratricopeptide (TPR) repeat protein
MDAAEAYRHLAQAYNKISRSADAELLARRAIDICAAVIDDSSSPLPEFMMTLAISYRQQGKVSAAESVLLSILDLEESTGENKNVLVRTLTAYAELLICAGRKVEADAVLLKAKHIR